MTKTIKQTDTKTAVKLPSKASNVLTSLEENVLRMRYGVKESLDAPLGTKATTPEMAEMLFAIEARAYEMTGRADTGRGKKRAPKARIIETLKKKS